MRTNARAKPHVAKVSSARVAESERTRGTSASSSFGSSAHWRLPVIRFGKKPPAERRENGPSASVAGRLERATRATTRGGAESRHAHLDTHQDEPTVRRDGTARRRVSSAGRRRAAPRGCELVDVGSGALPSGSHGRGAARARSVRRRRDGNRAGHSPRSRPAACRQEARRPGRYHGAHASPTANAPTPSRKIRARPLSLSRPRTSLPSREKYPSRAFFRAPRRRSIDSSEARDEPVPREPPRPLFRARRLAPFLSSPPSLCPPPSAIDTPRPT